LNGKNFLVGDKITIADISWFCTVYGLFASLFSAEFRKEIPHAFSHFQKLAALPEFKAVAGDIPKLPDDEPEIEYKIVPTARFHRLLTIQYNEKQVTFKFYSDSQASDIVKTISTRFGLHPNQTFVLIDEEGYDVVCDGTLETGTYKLVIPYNEKKDDFVFTYFALRYRGEATRLIFAEAQAAFTERNFAWDEWREQHKDKLTKSGELPFGELPRLQNGDVNIVQSNAIIRYLARKFHLYGTNAQEHTQVDIWLDEAEDIRARLAKPLFAEKLSEQSKNDLRPAAERTFELIEAQLGRLEVKNYLVGNHVTVADLSLWEVVDTHKIIHPDVLSKYPLFEAWYNRVASRPNIASYLAGKRHPINFG